MIPPPLPRFLSVVIQRILCGVLGRHFGVQPQREKGSQFGVYYVMDTYTETWETERNAHKPMQHKSKHNLTDMAKFR